MRYIMLLLLVTLLTSESLYAIRKVTIRGRIRAYKEFPYKSKEDEVTVTSFDPYFNIFKARVDNDGNFTLTFPKGFTGDVEFKFIDNTPVRVIVSPGDRQYYVVEPHAKTTIVNFTGDHAKVNQQISKYLKSRTQFWATNGRIERPLNMIQTGISMISVSSETFEQRKAFLEGYIKENQVSKMFIKWARLDLDYDYAARHFHLMSNQHQPISDPAFFSQFPLDDAESLISANYLTYLYVVRSSAIYGSPQINTFIIYPKNPKISALYDALKSKNRKIFETMRENSNLSDSAIMTNMQYPDSVSKYALTKTDRFTINYIKSKTSGLVRDFYLANYILNILRGKSNSAITADRYSMLVSEYKKYVSRRTYLYALKDAYINTAAGQKLTH